VMEDVGTRLASKEVTTNGRTNKGFGAQLTDDRRSILVWAGAVYLSVMAVVPILLTPYRFDDTFDRLVPQQLSKPGGSYLGWFLGQTVPWMRNQGRFFPGAVAWREFVFTTFTTRASYKLFMAVLSVMVIAAIVALVWKMSGTNLVGAVAVTSLAATWTLRVWTDGLDSFAGLLPWTILTTIGALLLLIRARGRLSIVLAVALWSCTLVTYEVAILITPALLLCVWLSGRGLARSLALICPALVDLLIVLVLRSQAVAIVPAYKINLDFSAVVGTYIRQTAAALPLSQLWYPGATLGMFPLRLGFIALIIIGIPAALMLVAVWLSRPNPAWRALAGVGFFGATCWLAPPLLVAITQRWQVSLPPGEGYLSVVWGYVGVALVLMTFWLSLAKLSRQGRFPKTAFSLLALLTAYLAASAAFSFAASFSIASSIAYPVG
jgi:hypothetical protein